MYRSIDPISSKINQLVELQLNVAKELYAHTKEHDRQMLILVSSLLALALSGSIASGLYIIYRLSRQLGAEPAKVRLTTQRVAQGDLTIETPQDSHASSILAAVGCMTQDLKVVVKNVKNSTQDIAALGNQLHQRTQATRDMLNTQKSETDMITSAMTEMNATVHEVAKNTAAAAEASRTVELEMEKGLRIVDDSIKSIHLLANEVHQSVQVVSQLAEDSQEIKTILSVIGDIAEQTNLLALNAAIEAARAGEQGRGFAVVADEVRTLASRTHDSTEQIQNMVQKIQSGVAQSVTVMKRNEAVAQNSVTLAEQTQHSLHKISEAITTVNDMNTQIASAAEEQSLVTEEIHRNISVISTITHDSNDAFDEVWQAANNLSQMAERLDQDVAYFRL
ncbi:methyl-accepting chemotaxis protein [Oceanospirillum beijerinckii]|uniref:methyl-accepting chemotaxis protein n=1 Tax=Oceanospirillum beijerinckii TaxID=64976 RepID=UPI00041C34D9|nr:methyl-accepting chemotaxis protein [Oceanospirillum beijerinckii]